jgi:hypothetical protein
MPPDEEPFARQTNGDEFVDCYADGIGMKIDTVKNQQKIPLLKPAIAWSTNDLVRYPIFHAHLFALFPPSFRCHRAKQLTTHHAGSPARSPTSARPGGSAREEHQSQSKRDRCTNICRRRSNRQDKHRCC